MTELREVSISLVDWEARYVLQSVANELQRLKIISESSSDEDEVADAANDYVELSGLYETLTDKAVAVFGKQITTFGNEDI